MNRTTGGTITSLEHLHQSVADILSTPIGSRLMRRDYGCQVTELIDQPYNGATKLRAYAAIAMALLRWEPRLSITSVQLSQGTEAGQALLDIECTRVDNSEAINLQVPLQLGALT